MFFPFTIKADTIRQLKSSTGTYVSEGVDSEISTRRIQLMKYLDSTDGLIDGKTLKELWFPGGKYHIFLSHSHSDVGLARYLKAWFNVDCGLKCFIDADVWENAFDLLKELDNKYARSTNSSRYNYDRRNQTTSHVYSMLSIALFEAIDEIECPIFIESSNSVALKDGIEKGTLSPWIYEEISYMGHLPHKIPPRFPRQRTFSTGTELVILNEEVSDAIKISHPLDTKGFKAVDSYDLSIIRNYHGTAALDKLYLRKTLLNPSSWLR